MKQILLLLSLPFLSFFSLTAQITQEQADEIVIERLCNDTGDFTIYAKEDVQTNFELATATSETLELSYLCWVYYADFMEETNGKYLIVKESNGNVLEVNTKNDEEPEGLEEWRVIGEDSYPINIPFEEYSLGETLCLWTNLPHSYNSGLIIINSYEDMEQYIVCADGNYPEIDFSQNTLLLINGIASFRAINHISKQLQQISINEYKLYVELLSYKNVMGGFNPVECWHDAIITGKLSNETNIALNVTSMETSCKLFNLPYSDNNVLLINSTEELINFIECIDDDDFPEIDFSTHTLLMAVSNVIFGIQNINAQLTKTDENTYNLDIDILLDYTTGGAKWIVKTLISILPSDAVCTLNVNAHH